MCMIDDRGYGQHRHQKLILTISTAFHTLAKKAAVVIPGIVIIHGLPFGFGRVNILSLFTPMLPCLHVAGNLSTPGPDD